MSSATDNQVIGEAVIVDVQRPETNHHATYFTATCFLQFLGNIFNLAAIHRGIVAPLGHRLWAYYGARRAVGEEVVAMPRSTLDFIITCLLGFVEIKAQGNAEFPFDTHPWAIMVSVTGLVLYGIASASEYIMSVAGLNHTSVYVVIVSFGRVASLCVSVASLASLFYL